MNRTRAIRVVKLPAKVLLVGVGGTGGYVLQQAARLLYSMDRSGVRASSVILADGDIVEQKNLLTQYFLPADVGQNKAAVLADRYGRAYGLPIGAWPHYVDRETDLKEDGLVEEGSIVVACVDNAPTRAILHEQLMGLKHVVYVDAGNSATQPLSDEEHNDRYRLHEAINLGWEGQVVAGVRYNGETRIPFAGEVFPDLLVGEEPHPGEVSCGEEAASDPQRHQTNLRAATCVMGYLTTLLSNGTLVNHRTFFDARRDWSRSDAAIDAVLEVSI